MTDKKEIIVIDDRTRQVLLGLKRQQQDVNEKIQLVAGAYLSAKGIEEQTYQLLDDCSQLVPLPERENGEHKEDKPVS